jgi:cytosine/adenosine deaminase-related metal-dependent hydrolase
MLHECQRLDSPDHEAAALAAHRDLPGRAVLACSPTGSDWSQVRRLRDEVSSDRALLTMAAALGDPATLGPEETRAQVETGRELGLPMHVNGGFPMGLPPGGGVRILGELELLGPDLNFVHCNTTSDDEFALMVEAGSRTATSCPVTEVLVGLGLPALGRMHACGLAVAVGTDALCAATGDLLENARNGLTLARAWSESRVYADGRAVEAASDLGMSSYDALESITLNGARACGLGDRTGSLTPGKAADLVLLRGAALGLSPLNDPVPAVVSCANSSHVDTVVVAGRIVKRHGELVGIDTAATRTALEAAQERLAHA